MKSKISKKFIFITGGVVSSLGKGITASCIAHLLENHGYNVINQKMDPYLNLDPGTMSPFQHGEVYVTNDGKETDLDLGHYERFTKQTLNTYSSVTAGQIYSEILDKERRGDFLGHTVQVIPHVTDEIKKRLYLVGEDSGAEVTIVEIGGTVGDIEALPFFEAMRQVQRELGGQNCMFVHLTLVPYLKSAGELKTKPTQHSVERLRAIGIQPDVILCRSERKLTSDIRDKIVLFCNVEACAVIECRDVKGSLYELPCALKKEGLDQVILDKLGLGGRRYDLDREKKWKGLLPLSSRHSASVVRIAVIGKYINHQDSYISVYESLLHASYQNSCHVEIVKVDSETLTHEGVGVLENCDGVVVPGGFGERGVSGKLEAIQFCRINNKPFLGLCLGMQCAVIEFARNVCGLEDAMSVEFDAQTSDSVICYMSDQEEGSLKGGTMRLGAFSCRLKKGSRVADIYGVLDISERHRHRLELNNDYRDLLSRNGLVVSGENVDRGLCEIVEIKDHPFFIGVQFHPEFQSRFLTGHPLFINFVKVCLSLRRIN